MISNAWMNDPSLSDIGKEKLDFLQKLAFESNNLSQQEKMPFFMALANKAKQAHITFSPNEMERIITVLKRNASPSELVKMEQILKVYKEKS